MSYVLQYCIQLYKIYVVFPLQVDDSKNSKVSISQVIILIYFSCALYSYYIVGKYSHIKWKSKHLLESLWFSTLFAIYALG